MWEVLHHQHRKGCPLLEVDAEKLDNVRVAESAHDVTLFHELRPDIVRSLVEGVYQRFVDLLSRHHHPVHLQLLHNAIRSIP